MAPGLAFPDLHGRCPALEIGEHSGIAARGLNMFNIIFYSPGQTSLRLGTHRRKTCLTHPVIARRLEGGLFGVLETCSIGLDSTMFRSTKSWQAQILREVRSTFILPARAICTPRSWDVSSLTQVGIIPGRECMSI